jgi:hypothetical protein
MEKTLTRLVVAAALGYTATAQAVTINWTTNLEAGNAAFPASDLANVAPFGTLPGLPNPDFRIMINGNASGGGEKAISSGVSWDFNGSNLLTTVLGSPMTPGAAIYCAGSGCSVAPAGGVALFTPGFFGGAPLSFLAPTVGSAAGNAYGAGALSYGISDAFSMHFNVLEAQWAAANFNVGKTNGGVVFNCTGAQTGNIECFAERQLDASDDSLGFVDQYFQWHLTGTATPFASAVPIPATAWLFGSGLIGLVGVARHRKPAKFVDRLSIYAWLHRVASWRSCHRERL